MNIDGSNRPSLVAGSAAGASAPRPASRILADMENRRPAEGTAAASGANRMRWLLLAAGVLVILLVLVATARLLAPGNADPWRDRGAQTVGQSTPGAQAPDAEATPSQRPALIIDAAAGGAQAAQQDNPLALIQPARSGSDDAEVPETVQLPGPARQASSSGTVESRRVVPAPQARNTTERGPGAEADTNLISTLLGIIRQDGGAAAEPSSMDSLVARILAENERTHTETSAALASLGQPRAEEPDLTRAQRELQACPAANTVQGINCRDRICARWAGLDPACPGR